MARRSATVPAGTSAAGAIRAAQQAEGFTPAPSRVKRKKGGTRIDYEEGGSRPAGTVSRMVKRALELLSGDQRPDVPIEEATAKQQSERQAYLKASRDVQESLVAKGVPESVNGKAVKGIRTASNGSVDLIGERGRIVKNLRPAFRGDGGRFTKNIEEPIVKDPAKLKEAAEQRIKQMAGFFGFQDSRAGLTMGRETALKLAFALDRKRRGQPFPEGWDSL